VKYLLILLLFFAACCKPRTFAFKAGQKVSVIGGFYEGCKGWVGDWNSGSYQIERLTCGSERLKHYKNIRTKYLKVDNFYKEK